MARKSSGKISGTLLSTESVPNNKNIKIWSWVALSVCIVASVVLIGRVAWLQFVRGDELSQAAYEQQNSGRTIAASRGAIYDTNGSVLAVSISANKITASRTIINSTGDDYEGGREEYQKMIAKGLSDILGIEYDGLLEKLKGSGNYLEIASKLDIEVGDKVTEWKKNNNIKGVYIDSDTKRYYPNGSLASHVIGFTGKDGDGLVCGVEVALNDVLKGTAGRVITEVDALGNEVPTDEVKRIDPIDGYNVTLTLDATIQYMVEEALQDATIDFGVEEGCCCIVMDPDTGDILAMASNPSFDLNSPYSCPDGMDPTDWVNGSSETVEILNSTVWRNKALTDTYEPGSTFKTITACAGLEEGVVTPETEFSDSAVNLSGWTIHCWRREGHGTETFAKAIMNSCNPIMVRVSQKLGIKTFYSYVAAFGFTEKTGILLSGEANSVIHTNPTEIDMAVASFGQRLQITPLQLVSAYSAVANGGYLYEPRIVKEITDNDGNVIQRYETETVRQVISNDTSEKVLKMLEDTVSKGGGSRAYVSGYRIAGKTGTSETTTTDTTGRYVCSFAGIAPADDPEVVVLVVVDHPTIGGASGGVQAASVAGRLFQEILDYMEIEKRYTEDDLKNLLSAYEVPSFTEGTVADATYTINLSTFNYVIVGDKSDDAKIVAQFPAPGVKVARESTIVLYTDLESNISQVRVPDLNGLSLEDAHATLVGMGLNMRAYSLGTVVGQSIEAGTYVDKGSVIELDVIDEESENAGNDAVVEN
ncbi:MAG: PASTA domain-containing protein [Clostridia bacterium]|nr:PASTA domain-containing protein [Clostridia bacterium]